MVETRNRVVAKTVAPLSSQQELWCSNDQSFDPRFVVAKMLRVTGPIDVAALQGALDDTVARHEMLRTVIERHAQPPYQRVHPPSPVPLAVRDLSLPDHRSRDEIAGELHAEVTRSSVPLDELPLLRAYLYRFDDRDSVLGLVTHHTACDAWSIDLIFRELAAGYAIRTGASTRTMPHPLQYAEYARWQRDTGTGPAAVSNMAYWHRQLDDAEVFSLPTDRPVRQVHGTPYTSHRLVIDADLATAAARLARVTRTSLFVIMLAALNVTAHRIRHTLDPVINTIVHGRTRTRFRATVGPFLNFVALRTNLGDCTTFRDVVAHTRDTCLDAYEHEVPIQRVEQEIPTLMAPLAEPYSCDFIFGYVESAGTGPVDGNDGRDPYQLAEGSAWVHRNEQASEQMPGGAAWNLTLAPSGEVIGVFQFNPEEFDEGTVAAWMSDYHRILTAAVADPDREWKSL